MHWDHPELCSWKVLVELYPSSWNRGADERGLEVGDVGRGMRGVRGLCGPGGSIGAVVVLSAETASGD